jgi:hypothetical protein
MREVHQVRKNAPRETFEIKYTTSWTENSKFKNWKKGLASDRSRVQKNETRITEEVLNKSKPTALTEKYFLLFIKPPVRQCHIMATSTYYSLRKNCVYVILLTS